MSTEEKTKITVETTVNAPVEKVWKAWTTPSDITQWNNASDDWRLKRLLHTYIITSEHPITQLL